MYNPLRLRFILEWSFPCYGASTNSPVSSTSSTWIEHGCTSFSGLKWLQEQRWWWDPKISTRVVVVNFFEMTRDSLLVGIETVMNLANVQYFTNLDITEIGGFPLLNHHLGVSFLVVFGRYNLTRMRPREDLIEVNVVSQLCGGLFWDRMNSRIASFSLILGFYHLTCHETLEIVGYLPYQLVLNIYSINTRWWQLKYVWNFHPKIWGRWTHFDEHTFAKGLKQLVIYLRNMPQLFLYIYQGT